MIILSWLIFIKLSRSGTIGQNKVEYILIPYSFGVVTTILLAVSKANQGMEGPRLEPLLKDRGFIFKLKQGSVVPTVFTVINVFS